MKAGDQAPSSTTADPPDGQDDPSIEGLAALEYAEADGRHHSEQAVDEAGPTASARDASQQANAAGDRESESRTEYANTRASVAGNKFKQEGDINIVAGTAVFSAMANAQEEVHSLFDFLIDLPLRDFYLPPVEPNKLPIYANRLKQDRILLISCGDIEIAMDVAYRALCVLGGEGDLIKQMIDLEHKDTEKLDVRIDSFSRKGSDSKKNSAILVKALGDKGRDFLYSLYGDRTMRGKVQKGLEDNRLFLLCIVEGQDVADKPKDHNRELHFGYWHIPFLQPLLQNHYSDEYSELAQRILDQQAGGKWSKNESSFCNEIIIAIKERPLKEEIDKRENLTSLKSLFKGDAPLNDTALYVATFFPNLTLAEFRRIIRLLLDAYGPSSNAQLAKDDGSAATQGLAQPTSGPPREELTDDLLEACQLEVLLLRDGSKVIGFPNYRLRERLKEHLEKRYPMYLARQFEVLHERGILFDPSPRIADSTTRLVVDLISGCSDDDGSDWLVNIVKQLPHSFGAAEAAPDWPLSPIFAGLKNVQRNKSALAYGRIAIWLREMLKAPELANMVNDFLAKLMFPMPDASVLELIKRIRFAPNFDEYYWLKQMFDRGNKAVRDQTFAYLYGRLRSMDAQIYEVLFGLNRWLDVAKGNNFPQSTLYALQLLIFYCVNTITHFDSNGYGLWPSRYPLFPSAATATAKSYLGLLTAWLFHPGMDQALEKIKPEVNRDWLIADLICEWVYILCGLGEDAALNDPAYSSSAALDEAELSAPLPPAAWRMLLIENVASRCDGAQPREFITYWSERRQEMMLSKAPQTRQQKGALQWKSKLLGELIKDFSASLKRLTPVERKE